MANNQNILDKLISEAQRVFSENKEQIKDKSKFAKIKSEILTISELCKIDISLCDFGDQITICEGDFNMTIAANAIFEICRRFSKLPECKISKEVVFNLGDVVELVDVKGWDKFTDKKSLRAQYQSVYIDNSNGYKVATEANILRLQAIERSSEANFYVDSKGAKIEQSANYVNYLGVIPSQGAKISLPLAFWSYIKTVKSKNVASIQMEVASDKITLKTLDFDRVQIACNVIECCTGITGVINGRFMMDKLKAIAPLKPLTLFACGVNVVFERENELILLMACVDGANTSLSVEGCDNSAINLPTLEVVNIEMFDDVDAVEVCNIESTKKVVICDIEPQRQKEIKTTPIFGRLLDVVRVVPRYAVILLIGLFVLLGGGAGGVSGVSGRASPLANIGVAEQIYSNGFKLCFNALNIFAGEYINTS